MEPFQLGVWRESALIRPEQEDCVSVDAGPLYFLIESRQLTDAIVSAAMTHAPEWQPKDSGYDDYGGSLHVLGRADDFEYLRFDCFAKDPHYHYIRRGQKGSLICRLDEIANGDPIDWVLGRIRERLPNMLEFAGNKSLAEAARNAHREIQSAASQAAELLRAAGHRAAAQRLASS